MAEGQAILAKYGIDPWMDVENLVWAPNIKGMHTTDRLQEVVDLLKAADATKGAKKVRKAAVVSALKIAGRKAANHK